MHVAAVTEIVHNLIPALEGLHGALAAKAKAFENIIKIGRTHLQVSLANRTSVHHTYVLSIRTQLL